jgi:hypothetical protein
MPRSVVLGQDGISQSGEINLAKLAKWDFNIH